MKSGPVACSSRRQALTTKGGYSNGSYANRTSNPEFRQFTETNSEFHIA
jgi:hypothetical protein